MKYLLTGGGTGGHVYPALAIKELITNDDAQADFLYIGVAGKAEEFILGSLGDAEKIPIRYIHASGLPRVLHISKIWRFLHELFLGFRESLEILKTFEPDIIIATGGYVTAPAILAGRCKHKKLVLFESNSVPGLVNKGLSRLAHRVLVTFPETVSAFTQGKAKTVGYPVRRRIKQLPKDSARKRWGLPGDARVAFVLGGSSGAQSINEAIVRNLELVLAAENIVLIHGTGRDIPDGSQSFSTTKKLLYELYPSPPPEDRYMMKDYFHEIDSMYCAADLVVSRAGSGTIMECAALGIPMILVPKSGLPGDHQVKNAETVERAGGGVLVREELYRGRAVLDGEHLVRTIIDTVSDASRLLEMRKNIRTIYTKDSNKRILEEINQILEKD